MTQRDFDTYQSFYTHQPDERPRIIIDYEATAYAFELELINLILEGGLEKAVMDKTLTAQNLGQDLNARTDQLPLLELICDLAYCYFPERLSEKSFSERYFKKVVLAYQNVGYRLFAYSNSGELVEMLLEADPNR
jgi:hypothetical protein